MDSRFSAAAAAPIFKKVRNSTHKTKLDPRFSGVLSDDRFQLNPGEVDKYGRKTKRKDKREAALKELQQFYEIEEQEQVESDNGEEVTSSSTRHSEANTKKERKPQRGQQRKGPNAMESRLDYLNKLSRGEISESDSEASHSTDSGESGEDLREEDEGRMDEDEGDDVILAEGAETNRLAIQNCDWDNMKAVDIL